MSRIWIAALLLVGVLDFPSTARAQTVGGFAGLTVRGFTNAPTFGGTLAVSLTDNIQLVGEGGKMTDIMSSTLATLLTLAPVDVRLAAYYGEGGVRLLGGRGSGLRPYAEATAGFARMHLEFSGAGTKQDAIINAGLLFLDRTERMVGLGAGLIVQAGPALVDLGYRYKKIGGGNPVQSVLTGGDFGISQVRLGVGVRF